METGVEGKERIKYGTDQPRASKTPLRTAWHLYDGFMLLGQFGDRAFICSTSALWQRCQLAGREAFEGVRWEHMKEYLHCCRQ